jgi:hypothetical protein
VDDKFGQTSNGADRVNYFELDNNDRRDLLQKMSILLHRPATIVEKDIWITRILSCISELPECDCLIFCGGTSLSKVYHLIDRFSEDLDFVYDVRRLLPDIAEDAGKVIPENRSGADRMVKAVRHALNKIIVERIVPILVERLSVHADLAIISERRAGSEKNPRDIIIRYPSIIPVGNQYLLPEIRLEFRGTSTGEPCANQDVPCICEELQAGVTFPKANIKVADKMKILLDKMMICHSACFLDKTCGERMARHWYDVYKMGWLLEEPGFRHVTDSILADQIRYRNMFYPRAAAGLNAFETGDIEMAPRENSAIWTSMKIDYGKMVSSGMLYDSPPPSFEDILHGSFEASQTYNAFFSVSPGY